MKFFIPLFLCCCSNVLFAQEQPVMFHKGIVSNDAVFGLTISPTSDHALWVQSNGGKRDTLVVMEATVKKGKIKNKRVAAFSAGAAAGKWKDIDPMFSPDGNTIYFQSTRPVPGKPGRKGFDIWAVQKLSRGRWSAAYHLGNTLNSDSSESYSSVSRNGNMYFTIATKGMTDIYMSAFVNGAYQAPVPLPSVINDVNERESNPFIAADESYLLYFSTGKSGLGEVDLYISFRENGEWQQPINLGSPINSSIAEFCPFYHAAEKRLYFSRQHKESSGRMVENIYSVDVNIERWTTGKDVK